MLFSRSDFENIDAKIQIAIKEKYSAEEIKIHQRPLAMI